MIKRFTTLESGIDYGVRDNLTDNNVFDVNITDLLNSYDNELESYKSGNRTLQERLKEVTDENKQLKKELNDCEKFRYSVFKKISELGDNK